MTKTIQCFGLKPQLSDNYTEIIVVSQHNFHIIIDVVKDPDFDDVDIEIVREPLMPCIFDSHGRSTRESLVWHEVGLCGWKWFLGDDVYGSLFTGRFSIKGSLWYEQDYWGEWDQGVDIDSLEGQNRKTKRKLTRLAANK